MPRGAHHYIPPPYHPSRQGVRGWVMVGLVVSLGERRIAIA
jgi:hypothetical protein